MSLDEGARRCPGTRTTSTRSQAAAPHRSPGSRSPADGGGRHL